MREKICSHCGTTVLVGLQYCPGCLRPVHPQDGDDAPSGTAAPEPQGLDLQSQFDPNSWTGDASALGTEDLSRFTTRAGTSISLSEGYTRVVCPKCLRAHRAALNLLPTARLMCNGCLHQFPASSAAEFRTGVDLHCLNCGVTTFCVSGPKIKHCPNCKLQVARQRSPEVAKMIVLASVVGSVILLGFGHAVATQTTAQFLTWLCIGTVFTVVGFVVMVALGL